MIHLWSKHCIKHLTLENVIFFFIMTASLHLFVQAVNTTLSKARDAVWTVWSVISCSTCSSSNILLWLLRFFMNKSLLCICRKCDVFWFFGYKILFTIYNFTFYTCEHGRWKVHEPMLVIWAAQPGANGQLSCLHSFKIFWHMKPSYTSN